MSLVIDYLKLMGFFVFLKQDSFNTLKGIYKGTIITIHKPPIE